MLPRKFLLGLARVTAGIGAGIGTLALGNWLVTRAAGALQSTLGGEPHFYLWKYGADYHNIYYEVQGEREAEPVLLVHSLHVGGSSYEWERTGPALAGRARVYALDLLGFGLSDRPNAEYSASLYIQLLHDFVRDVIGRPVSVIASSLSCTYLVTNAARAPDQYRRLLLICPTGIQSRVWASSPQRRFVSRLLRSPLLGTALFNLLVSKVSLRQLLQQQGYSDKKQITPALLHSYYKTSHQPGARFAPIAFITGFLNHSIAEDFARLAQPVSLVWGRQARTNPLENAGDFLRLNPRATFYVLEHSALLPHIEEPEECNRIVMEWLEKERF